MDKKSFVCYWQWLDLMCSVPAEEAKEILNLIHEYINGSDDLEMYDNWTGAYFRTNILPVLEENNRKKEEYRQQQSEKGAKGAESKRRTRSNQSQPLLATAETIEPKPTEANRSKPNNGNGNGNGNQEKEKKEKPPLDSLIDDKDVAEALSKWLDVRMQIGLYPYGSVTSCIDSCKQALAKYGKESCLAAIKDATDGAWKAIRWPKETARSGTTNKFAKMSNNQYDFDQLEKQLLKAQEV